MRELPFVGRQADTLRIHRMMLSAKDLLRELVRTPSVNPGFTNGVSNSVGEGRVTDFLQNFFENFGRPWLRQVVHEGRDNFVVVFRAPESPVSREPLLWEVHQDTVGVAGMSIDPFAASESDGRIWGRGACDVKGGMAAMIAALVRAEAERANLRRTVILAFTIQRGVRIQWRHSAVPTLGFGR